MFRSRILYFNSGHLLLLSIAKLFVISHFLNLFSIHCRAMIHNQDEAKRKPGDSRLLHLRDHQKLTYCLVVFNQCHYSKVYSSNSSYSGLVGHHICTRLSSFVQLSARLKYAVPSLSMKSQSSLLSLQPEMHCRTTVWRHILPVASTAQSFKLHVWSS